MELIDGFDTDFIPSITEPTFEADYFGDPNDDVLVIEENNGARAYPIAILDLHHMVNDEIDGEPVIATWCPLCGSGVAYSRRVGDRTLTFEFAGKLADNNFVMRDRETGSEWKQSTGLCLRGELEGTELEPLSALMISYRSFNEQYPNGVVLARPESADPYLFYRFEKTMTALLAHPAGREVAEAVSHLVAAANLARDSEQRLVDVNVRPFFRIMQGLIELSDWTFHDTAREVVYDGDPMDIYRESGVFGFPPVHGGRRDWDVDKLNDLEAKTRVLGIVVDDDAVGFAEPRVEAADGVVETTVGETSIVVFATTDGLSVYENPGLSFESADEQGMFDADGARWNGTSGESDDGRTLQRLPGQWTFAFSWEGDHGIDTFYESERDDCTTRP